VEADIGQQNIGLASALRKAAAFVTTGGALWTRQRSSGVYYEKRRRYNSPGLKAKTTELVGMTIKI